MASLWYMLVCTTWIELSSFSNSHQVRVEQSMQDSLILESWFRSSKKHENVSRWFFLMETMLSGLGVMSLSGASHCTLRLPMKGDMESWSMQMTFSLRSAGESANSHSPLTAALRMRYFEQPVPMPSVQTLVSWDWLALMRAMTLSGSGTSPSVSRNTLKVCLAFLGMCSQMYFSGLQISVPSMSALNSEISFKASSMVLSSTRLHCFHMSQQDDPNETTLKYAFSGRLLMKRASASLAWAMFEPDIDPLLSSMNTYYAFPSQQKLSSKFSRQAWYESFALRGQKSGTKQMLAQYSSCHRESTKLGSCMAFQLSSRISSDLLLLLSTSKTRSFTFISCVGLKAPYSSFISTLILSASFGTRSLRNLFMHTSNHSWQLRYSYRLSPTSKFPSRTCTTSLSSLLVEYTIVFPSTTPQSNSSLASFFLKTFPNVVFPFIIAFSSVNADSGCTRKSNQISKVSFPLFLYS